MNLLNMIPAKYRKFVYAAYAALGIAFGAVQVGFATGGLDQPGWLGVSFAVFGYLGTALGLVAAANVPTREAEISVGELVVDVKGEHEADDQLGQADGRTLGAIALAVAVAVLLIIIL